MKFTTSLSLLTINGCCTNRRKDLRLQLMKNRFLESKYNIRKVRNFIVLTLRDLAINICIYSRGGFKFTISQSNRLKIIISQLENVTNSLIKLIGTCYSGSIENVEAKLTQIAVLIRGNQTSLKISYEHLIALNQWHNNRAEWKLLNYRFCHSINHVSLENGNSNYFFPIFNEHKKVGGLKLYNNCKAILFVYNIDNLQDLVKVTLKFLQTISHGVLQNCVFRHQSECNVDSAI